MVQMNGIDIEGLVDTRADVSILSQKSWNPDWPLKKIYTQFTGIGKLSIYYQMSIGVGLRLGYLRIRNRVLLGLLTSRSSTPKKEEKLAKYIHIVLRKKNF